MRAQHIVNVLGRKPGGGEVGEIGPVFSVITQLMRAFLVIARAGVDQDGCARRPYYRAMKRENEQVADWVHQCRFEPTPMPPDNLEGHLGIKHGRLE